MGLFNKFFNKQKELPHTSDNDIIAMATGKLIDVSTVPDKVFSTKMMGDSVAFNYEGDSVTICSPANGKLSVLFPTGHAFGITMNNGTEILIHIGINTVENNGVGFKILNKKQGDSIKAGEEVVKVDLNNLRNKYDMSTILIITDSNGNDYHFIEPQDVEYAQKIIK